MPRVLIIDDDQALSRLLQEHLRNEGFEVLAAYMAEDGFEKAISSRPDLIMLDVQLPDATGFQTCGRLRQNPITQSIPIIIMTGSARNANQQEIGRRMGANDYIIKPFNILEVGDKVHALLESVLPRGMPKSLDVEKSNVLENAPPPLVERFDSAVTFDTSSSPVQEFSRMTAVDMIPIRPPTEFASSEQRIPITINSIAPDEAPMKEADPIPVPHDEPMVEPVQENRETVGSPEAAPTHIPAPAPAERKFKRFAWDPTKVQPIITLLSGILILLMPQHFIAIVGIYLVMVGTLGIWG